MEDPVTGSGASGERAEGDCREETEGENPGSIRKTGASSEVSGREYSCFFSFSMVKYFNDF